MRAGHVSYLDRARERGRRDHRGPAPERAARAVRSTSRIPTPDRDGPWPGWARCDRLRVRQVLLNLLSNAVKYNRRDGSVEVSTVERDGELLIAIRDTGGGIPEELRPRLFAPFERLGTDPTVEGAGVGLALSKMLVEGMGGRILVDSVPGVGSTFTIALPATEAVGDGASVATAQPAPGGFGLELTGVRVLCIEDNAANVRLIQAMTAVFGVAATFTATTGEEGIALATEAQPDVILLDLHLPDMPGAVVLRRLRRVEPTRDIPVIVVSADASPKTARELLDAGCRALSHQARGRRRALRGHRRRDHVGVSACGDVGVAGDRLDPLPSPPRRNPRPAARPDGPPGRVRARFSWIQRRLRAAHRRHDACPAGVGSGPEMSVHSSLTVPGLAWSAAAVRTGTTVGA